MQTIKHILFITMLLNCVLVSGQISTTPIPEKYFSTSKLTIEPGIGLRPYPLSDLLVSNIIQFNVTKRLSFVSHSSYSFNDAFIRDFNFIKTNYNFSLSQKFGIGTSLYSKHSSHTFSILAGIKYDGFKETLNNPEFEKVTVSVSSLSPDFGLLYNLKVGRNKYFFSYRMYLPLYPYPLKSMDIFSIDGNMANLSLEIGLGIRL